MDEKCMLIKRVFKYFLRVRTNFKLKINYQYFLTKETSLQCTNVRVLRVKMSFSVLSVCYENETSHLICLASVRCPKNVLDTIVTIFINFCIAQKIPTRNCISNVTTKNGILLYYFIPLTPGALHVLVSTKRVRTFIFVERGATSVAHADVWLLPCLHSVPYLICTVKY